MVQPEYKPEFKTETKAAVPELQNLLNHPQVFGRVPAAIALWRIAQDTNAVAVLVAELEVAARNKRFEDPWAAETILTAMAELGPVAKAGTPILVNMIEFPRRSWPQFARSNILEKAHVALRQIDPEVEKQVKTYTQ